MIDEAFLSGELLEDKYRIEKLLGQGGMGAVYRATHLGTKRTVAIKVIHPRFSHSQEFVERFRREAEAAGRLRHPNVVDVTDFGFASTSSGQVAYLVMEYLDGCTLAEVLTEERRLPPDWVVDILEQVCSALQEAHLQGIIHRDPKPDNIWLEPNRRGGYTIKVLDFGLVKLGVSTLPEIELSRSTTGLSADPVAPSASADALEAEATQGEGSARSFLTEFPALIESTTAEEAATLMRKPANAAAPQPFGVRESSVPASPVIADDVEMSGMPKPATGAGGPVERAGAAGLTRIGSVMGTPLYMSPEQCRGERLDARSDIYGLGVIAYHMLTGETPFTGSLPELLRLHMTGEPQPIREKNPKVPKKMASLIMAALDKKPARRPESAAGFASALRASTEGSGTLLRRAVSLYSERFPIFLRISLLAHSPLITVVGLLYLSDQTDWWRHVPPTFITIISYLLVFGMIAANLLAYSTVSALTVPIVLQSMIAPLRPVHARTALANLRRRWRAFFAASVAVIAMILVGTTLFVIPGIVALVCYALYAPVVVTEGSGVRATLKRSRNLMKRSWTTVLVITVLQFALPVLVWIASVDLSFSFRMKDSFSFEEVRFGLSTSGTSCLFQLLNIFATPLAAIMTALLYLQTRRAGGESLNDAVEQFGALEILRSRWQTRMRSR